MKTRFDQIVDIIGKVENTIPLSSVIDKALSENITPSNKQSNSALFIGIDIQQSFMDNGELGVAGAHEDTRRTCEFLYNNIENISRITVSLDTHDPFQIFFPCWWSDTNNNYAPPYTTITFDSINKGEWKPNFMPIESINYVENLEKMGRKQLTIWPYHCIKGTSGNNLENQFANMVYFFAVAKRSRTHVIVKGTDPVSEMYGILKPEYSPTKYINIDFLDKISKYQKIFIAGQAKSHCVYESVLQILEHFSNNPEITERIYILEDCMSSIAGFESATELGFENFKKTYKINIIKSTDSVF